MYTVTHGPITTTMEGHHIAYSVDLWHGGLIVFLYVVATCGSMFVSKPRHVHWSASSTSSPLAASPR